MTEEILWEDAKVEHKEGNSSDVQSVYFMLDEWNIDDIEDWIDNHPQFEPVKVTKKGGQIRYRIRDPENFQRFITKVGHKDDKKIYFVIGFY